MLVVLRGQHSASTTLYVMLYAHGKSSELAFLSHTTLLQTIDCILHAVAFLRDT